MRRKMKLNIRKLMFELLQWTIIISLVISVCIRTRTVRSENADIVTGEISEIYMESGGLHTPYRVFFTISGRHCYYSANTKVLQNKNEVSEFVDLLRDAERTHKPVTVWIINHAEYFVNRMIVGECETVAAIKSENVDIPAEYYNQRSLIERIILLSVIAFVAVCKIVYYRFVDIPLGSKILIKQGKAKKH